MTEWSQELRLAARRLATARGFTLAVGLTLGLGVGVLATMFALVDAVLLRPLPFPDGERLVSVTHHAPALGLDDAGLSLASWAHYRDTPGLEGLAVYHEASINLTDAGEPERRALALVTPSYFAVLGLRAAHGRLFRDDDGEAGAQPIIVLGHDLWMRRYGGDPAIVGRTVAINEQARTVVGVLEAGPGWPRDDVQLFMNITQDPAEMRFGGFLRVAIGRLAPDVGIERAQMMLQTRTATLAADLPDITQAELDNAGLGVRVSALHSHLAREAAPALRLLLAAAGLVLFVSVANVAGLILARAEQVRRDVAIRGALGAGRRHIVRHFASEAVLLAVIGTALGLVTAAWVVTPSGAFAAGSVPRAQSARIDARIIAPMLGTGLLLCAILLLVPALRFRSVLRSTADALRTRTLPPAAARVRRALVTAQIALCLALLVGAILLGRSFTRLRSVQPGFNAVNVLTFDVRLPFSRFRGTATEQFHAQLAQRLRALPGVTQVGMTSGLPLTPSATHLTATLEVDNDASRAVPASIVLVSPGYFETMGLAVRSGWTPHETDRVDARRRVLVSASLARQLERAGGDAIGRRLRRAEPDGRITEWLTVAGIVDDVRDRSLAQAAGAILYVPVLDETTDPGFNPDLVTWVVRTTAAPLERIDAVRATLRELDLRVPLANVRSLSDVVAAATAHARFAALLIALGALLATVLALVGVWGVVAWSVAARTREFGLRIALGARARDVNALVLRGAARVLLAGLGIGVLPAVIVARAMRTQLHEVTPLDPAVWMLAILALVVAATAAAWFPALRAGRTPPARALAAD